ncbi:hypothetical protein [Noviherbaspirillum sp.]|uniref:tetratricopeptide repeat protein n=1 Tax=Noviherbaspirillum sp. TaxID=1926288 RepID=UPI002D7546F1|nr:hypothetical protein [Noviherbaspirillum sp.]HZW23387.1 hypothetical protein [Noviherbaspirillum sp.]
MANREDLLIIRAARAGEASAQLRLGKRYLFGGAGLPRSLPTALYWLDRAARQGEPEAWMLIGEHVPVETARGAAQPGRLALWYERAYDAGVAQAGIVLARLVLGGEHGLADDAVRNKAMRALQAAAHAGSAEAQWMLAQLPGQVARAECDERAGNEATLEWAARAARNGVPDARHAMAEHAWARGDLAAFLQWAGPLAEAIVSSGQPAGGASERDLALVLRAAHAMSANGSPEAAAITRLLEWAAQTGDSQAQLALGLWLARMDADGRRLEGVPGAANYKRAIRWLSLAAGHCLPEAWYALSKIYQKPEGALRSPADACRCLEKAAEAGHGLAQFDLGVSLWRARLGHPSNDVRAAEWLLKAQSRGVEAAPGMLARIAGNAEPAPWAEAILQRLPRDAAGSEPLLVARLELAARFGLSRAEALLIDPKASDCGHCLVVDVRAEHPHSKRRLVLVQTAQERRVLDRVVAAFERAAGGEEGNFRQRLYRLKTLA